MTLCYYIQPEQKEARKNIPKNFDLVEKCPPYFLRNMTDLHKKLESTRFITILDIRKAYH